MRLYFETLVTNFNVDTGVNSIKSSIRLESISQGFDSRDILNTVLPHWNKTELIHLKQTAGPEEACTI